MNTTNTEEFGRLMDYYTAKDLGPATEQQRDDSRSAAESDGGCGVITVDGRSVYVEE